jgi:type IX secretion system PorP/SprF family membrane protein
MPFRLLGRSHGAGLNLTNDRMGFQNDFLFSGSYAYRVDLGNGKLGIGISAGMMNQSLEPEWVAPDGMQSHEGDNNIPSSGGSVFAFDMALGLFYNTDNMYVGLSSTHVNQATFTYPTQGEEVSLTRHYYLMAGYVIQLNNPMFEVLPNLMLQTDARVHRLYLNTNIRYNKKFWGGVTYHVGGGLGLLVGIEMLNGLRIGYSYGVELSPLMSHSTGSHEVTVRYCFDLSVDKTPSKYKSIRFL